MRKLVASSIVSLLVVALDARAATVVVKPGSALPTIQSGVDAAAPGDTVVIFGGVYHESVVVPAGKPLTLKAKGKAIVDGRGPGGAPLGPGIFWAASGGAVRGLKFRNHATVAPDAPGLGIDYSPGSMSIAPFVVDKCSFEYCTSGGVIAEAGSVTVTRCTFRDIVAGRAVQIHGSGGRVEKCQAFGTIGISVVGGQARIRSNVVREGPAEGIFVSGTDVIVEKNTTADTSGPGIVCLGANEAVVRANTVQNSGFRGIIVQGGTLVIESNRVFDNPFGGLDVSGRSVTMRKNVVRRVRDIGFVVSGADMTIDQNVVEDSAAGLSLNVTQAAILRNVVRRCGATGAFGIRIQGSENTATKNQVVQQRGDGFILQGTQSTFVANTASGSSRDGFDVDGGEFVMQKNRAVGNGGEGFDLSVTALTFRQNVAKSNRLDLAASVPIATFDANAFGTGGPTTAPEIE